jgi:hypothetical protein
MPGRIVPKGPFGYAVSGPEDRFSGWKVLARKKSDSAHKSLFG